MGRRWRGLRGDAMGGSARWLALGASGAALCALVSVAGGHERWGNNARGCNAAGPGAASPGMGGYAPGLTGGRLLTGPAGAGLYSRGRGLGADDMLVTGAGLWIASDN